MALRLRAGHANLWEYQTTATGPEQTDLPYDAGQVGAAFDTSAGLITYTPADRPAMPDADRTAYPLSTKRWRGRGASEPATLSVLNDIELPIPGGEAIPIAGAAGTQGTPYDMWVPEVHHAVTHAEQARLGSQQPDTYPHIPHVEPALGRQHVGDLTYSLTAAAAVGPATYTVPDSRQTFNDAPGWRFPWRQRKAGYMATQDEFEPVPHSEINSRPQVDGTGSLAFLADRSRAGAQDPNSPDNRESVMPKAFYMRPWDKLMADRLIAQKGVYGSPQIARTIMTQNEDDSGAHIAAGGSYGGPNFMTPAPGQNPIGASPNTDRTIPPPWDSGYVQAVVTAVNPRRWGMR